MTAAPPLRMVTVKVADLAAANGDDVVVQTVGLGSCVAIVLDDRDARVGGLAHVLLPTLAQTRDCTNPAKVPETAVPALIEEMRRLGADPARLTARLVGGASMFGSLLANGGTNIGERNAAASREALRAAGIPVIAEDVGGDYGRSVYLHLRDGRVLVRSLRTGDREL